MDSSSGERRDSGDSRGPRTSEVSRGKVRGSVKRTGRTEGGGLGVET